MGKAMDAMMKARQRESQWNEAQLAKFRAEWGDKPPYRPNRLPSLIRNP